MFPMLLWLVLHLDTCRQHQLNSMGNNNDDDDDKMTPPHTVLYWCVFLLLLKETFPDYFYECTRSSFVEY